MEKELTNIVEAPFDFAVSYISFYSVIIISVILGIFFAFIANRNLRPKTMFVGIILSLIIYILLSSARGSNLVGSVPSVGYPIGPHLGLGGVSLQNRYPSKVGY